MTNNNKQPPKTTNQKSKINYGAGFLFRGSQAVRVLCRNRLQTRRVSLRQRPRGLGASSSCPNHSSVSITVYTTIDTTKFVFGSQADDILAYQMTKDPQSIVCEAWKTSMPPITTSETHGQHISNVKLVEDEVLQFDGKFRDRICRISRLIRSGS